MDHGPWTRRMSADAGGYGYIWTLPEKRADFVPTYRRGGGCRWRAGFIAKVPTYRQCADLSLQLYYPASKKKSETKDVNNKVDDARLSV